MLHHVIITIVSSRAIFYCLDLWTVIKMSRIKSESSFFVWCSYQGELNFGVPVKKNRGAHHHLKSITLLWKGKLWEFPQQSAPLELIGWFSCCRETHLRVPGHQTTRIQVERKHSMAPCGWRIIILCIVENRTLQAEGMVIQELF